jgi:NADH:ubiquinone oxidoreductase subunit H
MKQLCVLTLGLTLVVVFALFISTTFSVCHLIQLIKINFSPLETVDKMDELAEGYLVVYSSMLTVALVFLGLIGSLLWTFLFKDDFVSSRHYALINRIVIVTNIILVYAAAVLVLNTAFFMMIS